MVAQASSIESVMPRVAVVCCPCGLPKGHDEGSSEFFVSVVRDPGTKGERKGLVLGPYATHEEALANVDRGRTMADKFDPFTAFDAFGTIALEAGRWKGALGI